MFSRRMQTQFDMKRIETRLRILWNAFGRSFSTQYVKTRLEKKTNRVSTLSENHLTCLNAFCLLTAFKRVSDILSVVLGCYHIFERCFTRLFLVFQTWLYSNNLCSRRVKRMMEIVHLHIFDLSKLY